MFWISYKDLLKKYQHFDRTRLFGPEWTVTQQWTCLDVDWSADYHDTKFSIKLTQTSSVVIVLSQVLSYKTCQQFFLLITCSWILDISRDLKANTTFNFNSGLSKTVRKTTLSAVTATTS